MYKYTAYDVLRYLKDPVAITLYSIFYIFNILVSAAAGPAAVTVGLRRTGSPLYSPDDIRRFLLIAFGIAVIRVTVLSTIATLFKLSAYNWFCCHPLLPSWKYRYSRPRLYYFECIGGHGAASCINECTGPFCIMFPAVIVLWFGGAAGFAAVLAALTGKLLVGTPPLWMVYSGMAAGVTLAFTDMAYASKMMQGSIIGSQILTHTIGALVFAAASRAQGHELCSLGTAAAAGATFGALLFAGKIPEEIIYLSCCYNKTCSEPWPEPDDNPIACRLFPTATYKEAKEKARVLHEIELDENREYEEESNKHPKLHKVYWSRGRGIKKITHYVIMINGHKYELRDLTGARNRQNITYHTAPIRMPWTQISIQQPEQHHSDTALLTDYNVSETDPEKFTHHLIGWTDLTHSEIDKICRTLSSKWKYVLTPSFSPRHWTSLFLRSDQRRNGNCQHFLRELAKKIVKFESDVNREWFMNDRVGGGTTL